MTKASVKTDDKTKRGKRLLIYGMFALVLVTIVSVFMSTWLITAPLGATSAPVQITLIVGLIAIVACVIVWFVYTKLILKE